MQDPKKEIATIYRTLCMTRDADELESTVTKHFASDARLSHPLCKANSRNEILGFYQWCRLASPATDVKVSSVFYDSDQNILVFDFKEKLNVWFIPLPSKYAKMVVRLKLRKTGGNYYIVSEEDLVHPMDQIGSLASPLVPVVQMCCRAGCLLSNLGACMFRIMGLNSGLRGGEMNCAGVMEAAGLARMAGGNKVNGSVKE